MQENAEKYQQLSEYFQIDYRANASIIPVEQLPDVESFEQNTPILFRLASEIATLEQSALRPLRHLGDVANELHDYLKIQSRKIDLMMSYILSQEDSDDVRYSTTKLGGGGFTFRSKKAFSLGEQAQIKLFLHDEAAALYCFGEIVRVETVNTAIADASMDDNVEEEYLNSVLFSRIRDEDREILVRASLHAQTKQLKRRRIEREQS